MSPALQRAFALFALCAVGCGVHEPPNAAHSPGRASDSSADASPAALPSADRARVVSLHLGLVVEDVSAGLASVRDLVQAQHGYVEDATARLAHAESAQLDVRVPAESLPAFRAAVAELGEIESERESAEDVTEQRADLGARLRNSGAEEQRLLDLLAERTGDLADVLAVEAQLTRVRESIERMQAQRRVLERDVAYARVHLDIASRTAAFSDTPGQSIATAGKEGFEFAWSILVGLTMMAVGVAPTALLWFACGMLFLLSLRLLQRVRRRRPRSA